MTMRKSPPSWRHRHAAALLGLLLALLLSGCGEEQEEDELEGLIGPGAGGAPVVQATVVTEPLLSPAGAEVGLLDYDAGYWTRTFAGGAEDPVYFIYEREAEGLVMALLRISGRPDTPCRFDAALLARDEGFEILASGDVINGQGLEFHQVNLAREDVRQRFYCVELRNNLGVQFSLTAPAAEPLAYEQVHFVLNSTRL